MRREVSLEEISDGRLYELNDMVKADCQDCAGCHDCCEGMGDSVVLDPMDVYRLSQGLGKSPTELVSAGWIQFDAMDGNILPHLCMTGKNESCVFLNAQGRCRIHSVRPGFCRLFPLGRYYENGSFKYFLQIHECKKQNRTKIKVKKWIDTPEAATNEQFICDWHYLLKDAERVIQEKKDDEVSKNWNLYLLKLFYMKPYQMGEAFYPQFYQRYFEAREVLERL